MEQSAQELGEQFAAEMIENLQRNVREEKARREKQRDEYQMNGTCC